MNYWTPYLKSIPSFTYEFSFKVNSENYKERILAFDSVFLKKGIELGICVFDELENNDAVEYYLSDRREKFWLQPNYNNAMNLLDLKQSKSYLGTATPVINAPFVKPNNIVSEEFVDLKTSFAMLRFDGLQDVREDELLEEFWEEKEIFFSISSNSNIWWDEFNLTILNGVKWSERVLFMPTADNRSCSYRITPRFNSLICEISNIINVFEGKILLEEFNSRYVTEQGILIDGEVIYQEDIIARTINLLEIDKRSFKHNQSIKEVKI